MSAILARLQTLGLAKETTPGTYLAPIRSIPVTAPKPEDVIAELRDESFRGNDAILQGIYGGPAHGTFDYTIPHLYPDVLGDHLRAILGPDTLTAGISTTLSAATTVGATSISVAATILANSTIMIDTGAKAEYAVTGTPSGAGPYTIPLTSTGTGTTLAQAHASGATVVSAAKHSFGQDNRANPIPTYSLTQFRGAAVLGALGYSGCLLSDLDVKIDPKGAVQADAKWQGFPPATQTTPVASFGNAQPLLGWQWTVTLAGVASTRPISGSVTLKRAVEPIQAATGTQAPREMFADALEWDYTMKAIFDALTDETQFTGYSSLPVVLTLTQPLASGGAVLTLTSDSAKHIKFTSDFGSKYVQADINGSSQFNATDSGLGLIVLTNFINTAY